jgi:hypothetical protein
VRGKKVFMDLHLPGFEFFSKSGLTNHFACCSISIEIVATIQPCTTKYLFVSYPELVEGIGPMKPSNRP